MILKPGDIVRFKDKLTLPVALALNKAGISHATFITYKGTVVTITSITHYRSGEIAAYIRTTGFHWPFEVFEEDNEF